MSIPQTDEFNLRLHDRTIIIMGRMWVHLLQS